MTPEAPDPVHDEGPAALGEEAARPVATSQPTRPDVSSSVERSRRICDAAKAYKAEGLEPVALYGINPKTGVGCTCPKGANCRSVAKHPRATAWAAAAPVTFDEIDRAYAGFGASGNVGIRTGAISGVVVIDEDHRGAWLALCADLGIEPPRTRTVRTGSGGQHIYLQHPGGTISNSASKLWPGIDVRADGGQVVAPPSVTPAGAYVLVDDAPIAPMPEALLARLVAKPQAPASPRVAVTTAPDEDDTYLRAGLERELARLDACRAAYSSTWRQGDPGPAWDATCHAVALNVIEIGNGLGLPLDEVQGLYLARAPRDAHFDPATKWAPAVAAVGDRKRVRPLTTAEEVATWVNEPGVRGDSTLSRTSAPAAAATADRLDDAHLAERVADVALRGRFCWAAAMGWLHWDGRRWAGTDEAQVTEVVRVHLKNWVASEVQAGAHPGRIKEIAATLSRNRISAVVGLARGILRVEAREFDNDPDVLVVGNGVVDLRTGALLPHDSGRLVTKMTPVDYVAGARHSDWDAALEALPDPVRPWLQERLGQASTGHMTPDDVLLVNSGGGANGKTTTYSAVTAALGDHATVVPDRLMLGNPGDHPTDLMTLRGVRLALIEELPEGNRLNIKRLKDTVGTATITARLIRQDNVTFRATHSLFVTTNYVPQVAESDHGTWRRLALVRFPFTFVGPGQPLTSATARPGTPGLRDRILAGREGQHKAVLAWIVEGARRWYANDRQMTPMPAVVRTDTDAWRADADRIHAYFSDRLIVDPAAHIVATELFSDFSTWLASHGHSGWSDQTFATRFGSHELVAGQGVTKRRVSAGAAPSRRDGLLPTLPGSRYMAWTGVAFQDAADEASPACWQGWQGQFGDALSNSSRESYQTTPATLDSEVWDPFAEAGAA